MSARTARREPSTPPSIPGFTYVRLLGMGGFADVFLYEQQMPRRSVAVKVLLAGALDEEVRRRFRLEADLMARLSHHPSIVTVHHADVAPDGRPYLVMEHCSRAGLGDRYRRERMGVAEVLRIGIRLASAVETAHRAGVLHRDIKPANVLVTDFGWPALTDFGIAATTGWSAGAALGMSIPWAPPELLAEDPEGDERSDVYSLAATVYSLLARRSPFEVPDASNSAADLVVRIERSPVPVTGRADVPDDLQAVLARAMDKQPARRFPSALALARALQQVETGLMLPGTALDLPDEPRGLPDEDTRDRGVGAGAAAATGGPAAAHGTAGYATDDPRGVPPGQGSRDGVPHDRASGEASHDGAAADRPEADQATRVRPVTSISPVPAPHDAGTTAGPGLPSLVGPHDADRLIDAWGRSADGVAPAPAPERRRRSSRVLGAAAGALLLGGAAVAVGLAVTAPPRVAPDPSPTAQGRSTAGPTAAPVLAVPAPVDLEGRRTGPDEVEFVWRNPDPQEGDRYLWGALVAGQETVVTVVDEPRAVVPVQDAAGSEVCIEVAVVRADRRSSTTPAVGCVPGD